MIPTAFEKHRWQARLRARADAKKAGNALERKKLPTVIINDRWNDIGSVALP